MIDPSVMCRKHLLGEHGEIHKFRHNFVKKHNMEKRILLGQIEPAKMKARHDALAEEMTRRDFKHESPYEQPDLSYISQDLLAKEVYVPEAMHDLMERCDLCAERITQRYLKEADLAFE